MANYEQARVKLTNTLPNKFKSEKNFRYEELAHKLFLTTRQKMPLLIICQQI